MVVADESPLTLEGSVWKIQPPVAGGGGLPEPVGANPVEPSLKRGVMEATEPSRYPLVGMWERGAGDFGTASIWVTGQRKLGTRAVKLGYSGDHFLASYNAAFDFDYDDAFSVAAWVRTNSYGKTLISHRDYGSTGDKGWQIYVPNDGKIEVYIVGYWSSAYLLKKSTVDIRVGTDLWPWKHVCVTYDGSATAAGVEIYVDSVACSTSSGAVETLGTTSPKQPGGLYIGAAQNGSGAQYEYIGYLDDIAIWNTVLSQAKVDTLWNSGDGALANTVETGSIVCYYSCDIPGSPYPSKVADDSGNGLHAIYTP